MGGEEEKAFEEQFELSELLLFREFGQGLGLKSTSPVALKRWWIVVGSKAWFVQ